MLGAADKSEVAGSRRKTHGFKCRGADWARRPGASPTMRITASWCDPHTDRPNTRLWRGTSAPRWQAPPRISRAVLQAARLTHVGEKREAPTIAIHSASNSAE